MDPLQLTPMEDRLGKRLSDCDIRIASLSTVAALLCLGGGVIVAAFWPGPGGWGNPIFLVVLAVYFRVQALIHRLEWLHTENTALLLAAIRKAQDTGFIDSL